MSIPATTPGTLGRVRTPKAAIIRRLALASALAVTVLGPGASAASAGSDESITTKHGSAAFIDRGETLIANDKAQGPLQRHGVADLDGPEDGQGPVDDGARWQRPRQHPEQHEPSDSRGHEGAPEALLRQQRRRLQVQQGPSRHGLTTESAGALVPD